MADEQKREVCEEIAKLLAAKSEMISKIRAIQSQIASTDVELYRAGAPIELVSRSAASVCW